MEAKARIRPISVDGHYVVDFTQEGSPLLKDLKPPIRTIKYRIGNILYMVPRGADDATPDNIISVGGLIHDLLSGKISIESEEK